MINSVRAVIVKEGKLLCLKIVDRQAQHPFCYYVLPGGKISHVENMFDSIKRHCFEKVNATVRVHDLLFVRDYLSNCGACEHSIEHIFLCHPDNELEIKNGKYPDSNQIGIEWIPIRELDTYHFCPRNLQEVIIAFCKGEDVDIYLDEVRN
jgi:ADP-ribose pyrophosphatase YjhB (NUDIX family)